MCRPIYVCITFDAHINYTYTYIYTQLRIIGDVHCETLYNIALILNQSVITGDALQNIAHTYVYILDW